MTFQTGQTKWDGGSIYIYGTLNNNQYNVCEMQGLIKNDIKLNKYFTNIIKIAVVISDILEILYVFHIEKLNILIINE